MKKTPKTEEEKPNNTENLLVNILHHAHDSAKTHEKLTEHHLMSDHADHTTTHKLLEHNLVGQNMAIEEHKKTNKNLEEISKKLDPIPEEDENTFHIKVKKGEKGDKGDAPVKGKDYFTEEEKQEFIEKATPVKGVHYFDGYTPVKGVDYNDGYTPQKGVDYFDGKNGETPEIDYEYIISKVPKIPGPKGKDGKDLKPLSAKDILDLIGGKIDYDKHIKGTPNLDAWVRKQASKTVSLVELDDIDYSALAKNSAGKYVLGGGTAISIQTEIPTGTGTSFTLSKTPTTIILVTARGQILYPSGSNQGYTISGATITTSDSWSAGDILVVYI